MWKRITSIAIFIAGTMSLLPAHGLAGEAVGFESLPAPVRQSIRNLVPDKAPGDFQVDMPNPGIYEVAYRRRGIYYLITVDSDGTVERIQEKTEYRPLPSSVSNDRISGAASLNEDIIDMALAGDRKGVARKISRLAKALPSLRPDLGNDIYGNIAGLLTSMESYDRKGDLHAVSRAAVDAYRQLILSLDQTVMVAPIEVSLLDYSGFKLLILSHSARPDWPKIAAAVQQERDYRASLDARVKDSGLRDLMDSMQSGLDEAVAHKDARQVAFAARVALDSVDLLEGYFLNDYKGGAGALLPKSWKAGG